MKYRLTLTAACVLLAAAGMALAEPLSVDMHKVDKEGIQDKIGTVSIERTQHGLVLTPDLKGLEPGAHGFHLHQKGNCETSADGTPAGEAGGHYDPEETGTHGTPWGDGHLGDLPALQVDKDGKATYPVLAPRVTLNDMKGRALMIHAGGDNYSDEPKALGGGGKRVACGVVRP